MFLFCVGRVRYRIPGAVVHRDLCDLISSGAILWISKTGMVRIKLDDGISISRGYLIGISRDHAHVDVVH
jgi:hypothetical protein